MVGRDDLGGADGGEDVLDGRRLDFPIAGQEPEVLESRDLERPRIARGDALVGRLVDHAQPRPLLRQAVGERSGAVGAAVVDQEDLVVVERRLRGRGDVGNGALEVRSLVERGHEETDPTHATNTLRTAIRL